jgi:hypothetical protein
LPAKESLSFCSAGRKPPYLKRVLAWTEQLGVQDFATQSSKRCLLTRKQTLFSQPVQRDNLYDIPFLFDISTQPNSTKITSMASLLV